MSARLASRPARILHYEILVNGRFVDPMKVKLPRGRVLDGTLLAGFEQERARLEAMLDARVAQRYAASQSQMTRTNIRA